MYLLLLALLLVVTIVVVASTVIIVIHRFLHFDIQWFIEQLGLHFDELICNCLLCVLVMLVYDEPITEVLKCLGTLSWCLFNRHACHVTTITYSQ